MNNQRVFRLTATFPFFLSLALAFCPLLCAEETAAPAPAASLIEPGAELVTIAENLGFAEGPAIAPDGALVFSDINNNRICRWTKKEGLTVFRSESNKSNGLFFDRKGRLICCEGLTGQVAAFAPGGKLDVLASEYDGKRFNAPNDLWLDPDGGIYFTDPLYAKTPLPQDGMHVYYLAPGGGKPVRVAGDLNKPNGITGTEDGKKLYIADHGGKTVYLYDRNPDGTLATKRAFAPFASDGMVLDDAGNLYITEDGVKVFSPEGKLLLTIPTPTKPTNVCFGGEGRRTLYITIAKSVHALQMRVAGNTKSRAGGMKAE